LPPCLLPKVSRFTRILPLLRSPKFKLRRKSITIRSIRSITRTSKSLSQPATPTSLPKENAKKIRPPRSGLCQLQMRLSMVATDMTNLVKKNLFQHATLSNMPRANVRRPVLLPIGMSLLIMEPMDGNIEVKPAILKKLPSLFQPALPMNAKINLLLLLMTFHLTTVLPDGNTRVTQPMFRKILSQHATLSSMLRANAKRTVLLRSGTSHLLLRKNPSQHATLSSMPRVNARRTVLLRSTTSQVPMRPTTEPLDITSLTKESQSQHATLSNMLRENAKRTVLLRSGTSHLLLRKNPSQHATLSSMLRANAKKTA